jgi:hypothetical protein
MKRAWAQAQAPKTSAALQDIVDARGLGVQKF